MSDEELVLKAREAADDLVSALSTAANAGLILECKVGHSGYCSQEGRLTEQWDWYATVTARREILL